MSYLSLSNTSLVAIAISFAVICITIFSLRIVAQIKAKQALKDELAQHDNFAMGISFASEITVVIATMAFLFDVIVSLAPNPVTAFSHWPYLHIFTMLEKHSKNKLGRHASPRVHSV